MKSELTRDQAEVNKIVADAGKYSKGFPPREKEKNELLVKRIEGRMRKSQKVVHVDLGAFVRLIIRCALPIHLADRMKRGRKRMYDRVREFWLALSSSTLGDAEDLGVVPDSVVTAAAVQNEELRRLFRSDRVYRQETMSSFDLVSPFSGSLIGVWLAYVLCWEGGNDKSNSADYMEVSKQAREVLARASVGCTGTLRNHRLIFITPYTSKHDLSAFDVVSPLRAAVEAETALTTFARIANNKLFAKRCSDKNKSDDQFELKGDAEVVKAFMRDLPI
ncbi:hypothetical protein QFC22_005609 [Naganishia vaughanmartiniae]|uniref:Uncharacterized protein n=1 Tax=Naganishia vaughanmartiniae TaxID=1424756 RepID=A0ACC2WTB1_9TREE|nr:hypothetical protein QFC22_005609 [Naganishia vaughanmartiniae]